MSPFLYHCKDSIFQFHHFYLYIHDHRKLHILHLILAWNTYRCYMKNFHMKIRLMM